MPLIDFVYGGPSIVMFRTREGISSNNNFIIIGLKDCFRQASILMLAASPFRYQLKVSLSIKQELLGPFTSLVSYPLFLKKHMLIFPKFI